MSEMKVLNFTSKNEEESKKNKEYMLAIVDHFRSQIESGEVEEFVISYMDNYNDVQLSANCKDMVGAVGILEIGKQLIIHQTLMAD